MKHITRIVVIVICVAIATLLVVRYNQYENTIKKYNGAITPNNKVQVYAHRGFRGLLPENTIPSYEAALKLGVDYVDMDINMTKDGVLAVTHDLTLNPDITRDKNGKWITEKPLIHDLTYEQLSQYDVGRIKPNTQYSKLFSRQEPLDNVHIPKLEEVIEYVRSIAGEKVGFQIEIKNDAMHPERSASPKEYAVALYKIMKKYNIIDITEVQAFDWHCLLELKKLDPNIKLAFLTCKADESKPGYVEAHTGLDPKKFTSYPQMIKYYGGHLWEPYERDGTKAEIDEAHKLGIAVVAWGWPEYDETKFGYEVIDTLIGWNIDGIITDRPDILRGVLVANGYNVPQGFFINNDKNK